jgi:RNA polymerase sigma-70 factor (ECF subfamily)
MAPFPTTRWTRLAKVAGSRHAEARAALEGLCRDYWFPLYAFIRRRGLDAHEAEDAVQGLFSSLIERGDLADVDRAKGRFRSYLRAACDHFLANLRDHNQAGKRGGGQTVVSIDRLDAESRYGREPVHGLTPERVFEREWALTLLGRVLSRLEAESATAGKSELFEQLRPLLQGDQRGPSYREIAAGLNMSEPALRVTAHRLRARYREIVKEEVGRTTEPDVCVDEEIADLLMALRAR